MKKVEKGHYVKVHYTGRLDNGDVFDSTEGSHPIEVHVGGGRVIKGFEDALVGMAPKEKKTFTVSPESGYGQRDENLERVFMRSDLPSDFEPQEGEIIAFQTPAGGQIPAVVKSVDEQKIEVDLNHPLAGKSLQFDIEVEEICDQPTEPTHECSPGCSCS